MAGRLGPRTSRTLAAALVAALPASLALLGGLRLLRRRAAPPRELRVPSALLAVGLLLWWLPAPLSGAPPGRAATDLAQASAVALAWFGVLSGASRDDGARWRAAVPGAVAALLLMALASVVEVAATGGRAAGWFDHPNLWGSVGAVSALGVLALRPAASPAALATLGAVAALLLASGSRGATLAFLLGAAWLLLRAAPPHRRRVLALAGALALAALVAAQPRFATSVAEALRAVAGRDGPTSPNLLAGPAQSLRVAVERAETADGVAVATLRRSGPEGWARLQYPLVLFPGEPYTISAELLGDPPEAEPGLLGVGERADGIRLSARAYRAPGGWTTRSDGPIGILAFDAAPTDDGWIRLAWTVRNESGRAVRWWVGPAPDLREGPSGARLRVRRLQAERGERASSYAPPAAVRRPLAAVQALDRLDAFAAAIAAVRQRPLLGWGATGFDSYVRANPPGQRTSVPRHAHNLWLQTLYERGLIGAFGLALTVVAVTALAPRTLAPIVLAVLAANAVDVTLWGAHALYALIAIGALARGDAGTP